jgi:acyl-CoA synthetase (AMP-forming)/AMP-acid ligase II
MRNLVIDFFSKSFDFIPKDRIYIQNKFHSVTYGEVQSSIASFKEQYSFLSGKNCALITSSRFELAKKIPLVAAVAKRLFLQPKCLKNAVIKEFYSKADIEYVINFSDSELDIVKLSDINLSNEIEQDWLLSTSGTTGTPKLVSYDISVLMKTSKKDITQGVNFNWALSYDLNRFAGLQVYLQAIASGSSLTISETTDDLSQSIELFINKSVNCMSATPSFWRKILMTKGSNKLPLNRVTLGGEIADQAVLDSLRKHFPDSAVIHIYASTEAGVGFTVKDYLAGFPYEYIGESKLPSNELKILDNILWIKTEFGADKIFNGILPIDSEGFINTGDIVEVKNDRVFFVGRESGTINVGGNKVVPEEIESVLNRHPQVTQSKAFGKKSPVLGMLVTVEVVCDKSLGQDEKKVFKKELIAFCKLSLTSFKVPAIIKFVDSIAVNESGKVVRK